MEDRTIVHNRVGVQGQFVPVEEESFVDIPEELYPLLESVQTFSTELSNGRVELGRLTQVLNHLVNVCNTAENNLAAVKNKIITDMGLADGNWAIDFENKRVGLVSPVQKPMPSVV
jgi:hypothetical protein